VLKINTALLLALGAQQYDINTYNRLMMPAKDKTNIYKILEYVKKMPPIDEFGNNIHHWACWLVVGLYLKIEDENKYEFLNRAKNLLGFHDWKIN